MEPLSAEETKGYIEYRLTFSGWSGKPHLGEDTYQAIHEYSKGIPRYINQVCTRMFLHGSIEDKASLTVQDVLLAAKQLTPHSEEQMDSLQRLLAASSETEKAQEVATISNVIPIHPQATTVESSAEAAATPEITEEPALDAYHQEKPYEIAETAALDAYHKQKPHERADEPKPDAHYKPQRYVYLGIALAAILPIAFFLSARHLEQADGPVHDSARRIASVIPSLETMDYRISSPLASLADQKPRDHVPLDEAAIEEPVPHEPVVTEGSAPLPVSTQPPAIPEPSTLAIPPEPAREQIMQPEPPRVVAQSPMKDAPSPSAKTTADTEVTGPLEVSAGDVKTSEAIAMLLSKAKQSIEAHRLTIPADNSAYFYYKEAKRLDPDNTDVRAGIARIAARYTTLASQAMKKMDFEKAEVFLARNLVVQSRNKQLLAMKKIYKN